MLARVGMRLRLRASALNLRPTFQRTFQNFRPLFSTFERNNICVRKLSLATTSRVEKNEEHTKQGPKRDNGVAGWLFVVSGMVFGMVVVGGLTRLTKSGLSMTDWKLPGQMPPTSEEGWTKEFAKYQESPEFRILHNQMSLSEFKFIYFMEYGHRQLGRCVGVAFALPFLYFASKGRLQRLPGVMPRCGMILGMIGCQGLIGWWMVKSGLEEPEGREIPRVSPYRLATHLLSAFAIYTMLFTTALRARTPTAYLTNAASNQGLRRTAMAIASAVGLTAASGAFVAGNQAGLCYNEWPLMGGRIIPQDIIDPKLQPRWRNIFENSSLVQFDHRMLGQGTFLLILGVWASARRIPLPPQARLATNALLAVACAQVTLGISTLLWLVPVDLAATHQAGSLTLLTVSLWLVHTLRLHPKAAVKLAKSIVPPAHASTAPARGFSSLARLTHKNAARVRPFAVKP